MSDSSNDLLSEMGKCSCRGYNLDRLLQPRILSILAREKLHGYRIIQELENMDKASCGKPDSTGIYRTLQGLEKKGLLEAAWETEDPGPARKCYGIIPKGRVCLENWLESLRDYQESLRLLIAHLEETEKLMDSRSGK